MRFYGQNKEDWFVYTQFFKTQVNGYFVDIGAHDGLHISNTLLFEKLGWEGICIEAHPIYYEKLKTNRKCNCIFAAAGNTDTDSVPFYLNKTGGLSSLDKNMEEVWKQQNRPMFTGYTETVVPMKTLNTILQDCKAPTTVDFVSIDVEGCEMLVLEGLDLNKYHVRVFVVEVIRDLQDKLDVLNNHMMKHKYQYIKTLGIENHIYYKPL